jgi:serine O-acetyltransferase
VNARTFTFGHGTHFLHVGSPHPGARARIPGLGLPEVVAALRRQRRGSVEAPDRSRHELPSREAVADVVEGLRAALFPAHFGPPDLSDEGVDYFVGRTLDATLSALHEQVRRALRFDDAAAGAPPEELEARAAQVARAFGARLPVVRELLDTDVHAAFDGDPAARSFDEALFCYPGITAITHHRLAHELHGLGVPLLARMIAERAHGVTGIEIHPGAQIGRSFFIDHGTGVVIGATALVGDRVRLYQGVTLGAKSFPVDERGAPLKGLPRHPILEDDVVVYVGATILGRVTIGRGSTIGGNVWLTRSVPPGSRVSQAEVRSECFGDGGGI